MQGRPTLGTAVALALAVVLVVGGPVGTTLATHESAGNFTAKPATAADRQPGIDDASYKSWSTAPEGAEPGTGFKYLDYSVLEWEAGTLGGCGPESSEVAGIDRGNDDPGTETDETVKDNIKSTYASEDRVAIEFIGPEDPVGESVHLNVTDEFVTHVTDCRGNPEEPGWYRLTGTVNGTTWEGEYVERTTTSHYFYICDCESRAEAREQLGPPPSAEPTATATPTRTATPTATAEPTPTRTPPAGTPFPTPEPTPTPSATATATATVTPTSEPTVTATPRSSTPSPTATPAAWAANTPASGPGFGVVVALLALLGCALVGRRLA